jgi:hypothetical protein
MINDNIPPLQAILKLVEYLESDEAKHYACKLADGEDTSRHIFNDVKVVSDWLDTQPGLPRLQCASSSAWHRLWKLSP